MTAAQGADMPRVRLLDARERDLDETGLRAWARAESSTAANVARSYCYPYALVASHDAQVGVDIERIEPCDERFAELIGTPSERAEAASTSDRDGYLTGLWCSKEALSKALGDALRYEPARLASPLRWPGGRAGSWRASELSAPRGHVAWLCWRSPPPAGTTFS